jgi:hypothetical protein
MPQIPEQRCWPLQVTISLRLPPFYFTNRSKMV